MAVVNSPTLGHQRRLHPGPPRISLHDIHGIEGILGRGEEVKTPLGPLMASTSGVPFQNQAQAVQGLPPCSSQATGVLPTPPMPASDSSASGLTSTRPGTGSHRPMKASERLGLPAPPPGFQVTAFIPPRLMSASQHPGLQHATPLSGVPVNIQSEEAGSQGASRKRRLTGSHTFSVCLANAASTTHRAHHSIQKSSTLPNWPGEGSMKPAGLVPSSSKYPPELALPPLAPFVLPAKPSQGFNPIAFASGIKALEGTPLGKLLNATPDIVVDGIPRRIVKTGDNSSAGGGIFAHAARLNRSRVFAPQVHIGQGQQLGEQGIGNQQQPRPGSVGALHAATDRRVSAPGQGGHVESGWVPSPENSSGAKENGVPGSEPLMGHESFVSRDGPWQTEMLKAQESRTQPRIGETQNLHALYQDLPRQQPVFEPLSVQGAGMEEVVSSRSEQFQHQQQSGQMGSSLVPFSVKDLTQIHTQPVAVTGWNQNESVGASLQKLPSQSSIAMLPTRPSAFRPVRPSTGGGAQNDSPGLRLHLPILDGSPEKAEGELGKHRLARGSGGTAHADVAPMLVESPYQGRKEMNSRNEGSFLLQPPSLVHSPEAQDDMPMGDPVPQAQAQGPAQGQPQVQVFQFFPRGAVDDDDLGTVASTKADSPGPLQLGSHTNVIELRISPQERERGGGTRELFPTMPVTHEEVPQLYCRERLDLALTPMAEGLVRRLAFGEGAGMNWQPEGEGGKGVDADVAEGGGGGAGADVDLALGLNLMARSMSVSSTSSATCPKRNGSTPAQQDHQGGAPGNQEDEGENTGGMGERERGVNASRVAESTITFHKVSEACQVADADRLAIVLESESQLFAECADWPEVAVFTGEGGEVAWVNRAFADAVGQPSHSAHASPGAKGRVVEGGSDVASWPVLLSASLEVSKGGGEGGAGQLYMPGKGRRVENFLRKCLGYLWTAGRF